MNTCLVIQSQDPSAEYLMGCKIGTSPTVCNNNLSAVRWETTKMILEPLNQLKQADARLKLTQGVLDGVVGEELGVLPGMDSIFQALAISKMMGLLGTAVAKTSQPLKRFDIVIYDEISNDETLRMIGMAKRARWYLKYLQNMAEKTDIGRLTAPSLLRLVKEAMSLNVGGLRFNGKMSYETGDVLSCRNSIWFFMFPGTSWLNTRSSQLLVLRICDSLRRQKCFKCSELIGLQQHFVYPSRC